MTAIVVIVYETLSIILIARTLYVIKKVAPTTRKFRKEVVRNFLLLAIRSNLKKKKNRRCTPFDSGTGNRYGSGLSTQFV